jgi:hypothetical protein
LVTAFSALTVWILRLAVQSKLELAWNELLDSILSVAIFHATPEASMSLGIFALCSHPRENK